MSTLVHLFENTEINEVEATLPATDREYIANRYNKYQEVYESLQEQVKQFKLLHEQCPNKYFDWSEESNYVTHNLDDKSIDRFERFRFSFLYPIERIHKLIAKLTKSLFADLESHFRKKYSIDLDMDYGAADTLGQSFSLDQLYAELIKAMDLDGSTLTEYALNQAMDVLQNKSASHFSLKGNRLSIERTAYNSNLPKYRTLFAYFLAGNIHSDAGDFLRINDDYSMHSIPEDTSKVAKVTTYKNLKMDISFTTQEALHEFLALFRLPVGIA